MNYSSYQLYSQLCVSTIHVSCMYAATRRVVRARAGGPPVPGHVCVCVWRLKCRSVIIDYRAGRLVSACSAGAGTTVCVALPTACDVVL